MPAMLETSRVGRRRFAALAMLAGFAAGCAHFGEAFDERVSRGVSGRHVRIAWSCDGAPSGEAPSAASARVGLAVSGPPEQRGLLTRAAYLPADATGEIVGEVFGQGSRVRTAQPFALGLSGAPLATQLREAVAARLRSVGIELAAESPAAPSALAIAIAKVWVATSSGGFFSLKGDLVAEVVWTAAFPAGAGSTPAWRRSFARRVHRRVAYAYVRDHEAALGEAWCGALDDFAAAARTELAPLLSASRRGAPPAW
jgi:hypothetical protein